MSKIILTAAVVVCLVLGFLWARSKYTLMRIRVTTPIVRPATLSGKVVTRSGPAAGAQVSLVPQPENKYDLPVIRTNSDANGDFNFPKVYPASYRIFATAPKDGATRSAELTIVLNKGEQKNINMTLDGP